MAIIYQRKRNGPWYADYVDADGIRTRKTTGTGDKTAAQLIADQWERDKALIKGGFVTTSAVKTRDSGSQSVSKFIGSYIAECKSNGQSAIHVSIKESQLNRLVKFTGAKILADITADEIARYLDDLKIKKLSNRTRNQHRTTFASLYEYLCEKHYAASNIVKGIKTLNDDKDRRRVRRALMKEEIALLFQVNSQRALYYKFAIYTGLRVRTAKAIRWCDIDIDAAIITVPAPIIKSAHDFELPIHPDLLGALREAKAQAKLPTDRVFNHIPSIRTFHRDCERAGIPRYDAAGRQLDRHALRTSFGTNLARSGVLPQHAMKLLGHTDLRTTMKHYTALTLDDRALALAKFTVPPPASNAQQTPTTKAG